MNLQEDIEIIPGYRLEAKLGQGQFGQVWRASSPGGTLLALKFLDLSANHGWKEFRSIQRVKQIRHAHLMPIVSLWLLDDDGNVLTNEEVADLATRETSRSETDTLVVDSLTSSGSAVHLVVATLLGDQTLGDRLRECRTQGRQGIPLDELLGYMEEAAKGLDFLNSATHSVGASQVGVQHCDIKPENIMLTGGSVVICDLGVTQVLAEARQDATATSLGGSPAYMPPELFQNKPSRTSDQYSLAITYHELRTGELPFHSQKYFDVVDAHRNGTLDLSRLPEPERAVIRKATATRPGDRYATATEMVADLKSAAQQTQAQAGRGRGKVLAILLLLGLVVGGSVAAWKWWPEPGPGPAGGGDGGGSEPIVDTTDGGSTPPVVTPPKLRQVELVISPADAEVTVNGTPRMPDPAGRIELEIPLDASLQVAARRLPDYEQEEFTITASELALSARQELTLRPSPALYARNADAMLAAGDTPAATEQYALAVKLQPNRYGRLPDPVVYDLKANNLRWIRRSTDDQTLIAVGNDDVIRRWRWLPDRVEELGKLAAAEQGIWSFTARDGWMAAGDEVGSVWVCDGVREPMRLFLFDKESERTQAGEVEVAIAAGGRYLVAATNSPLPGYTELFTWDLTKPDVAATREYLGRQEGEMPKLAAARQNPWVAVATFADRGLVQRWDLPGGKVSELGQQTDDVHAIAISNDDRLLVFGGEGTRLIDGNPATSRGRRQATLVDTSTGVVRTLTPGHDDVIESIVFDRSGPAFVTACAAGEAQFWRHALDEPATDAGDPPLVLLQNGHRGPIVASVCDAARGFVVTVGQDRIANLWDVRVRDPRPLMLETRTERIITAELTNDGNRLLLGGKDGVIHVYDVDRLLMIKRACDSEAIIPRPPTGGPAEDPVT